MSYFIRIRQKIQYYEIKNDGYSGITKFEYPILITPEDAISAKINQIPNKVFDSTQVDFHLILSNVTDRDILIEKLEFRLPSQALKSSSLIAKNDVNKSLNQSRISMNNKTALKNLSPQVDNFGLNKKESLGVLLSLKKEANYLVA